MRLPEQGYLVFCSAAEMQKLLDAWHAYASHKLQAALCRLETLLFPVFALLGL